MWQVTAEEGQTTIGTIKAISFDMDGTLVHLPGRLPEDWLLHVYKRLGLQFDPEQVRQVYQEAERLWQETIRRELGVTRASFVAWNRLILEKLGVRQRLDELAQQVQSAWESQEDLLFPEVPTVLAQLQLRGLPMGITTHRFPGAIGNSLERHGIEKYFRCIVHPQDGSTDQGKHAPKLWRQVISSLDLPAEQILHVGDDYQADLLGPRSQGLQALLIDRYGRFAHLPAESKIKNLSELLALITGRRL